MLDVFFTNSSSFYHSCTASPKQCKPLARILKPWWWNPQLEATKACRALMHWLWRAQKARRSAATPAPCFCSDHDCAFEANLSSPFIVALVPERLWCRHKTQPEDMPQGNSWHVPVHKAAWGHGMKVELGKSTPLERQAGWPSSPQSFTTQIHPATFTSHQEDLQSDAQLKK